VAADAKEIIFTSGATESNNLAIKGMAHFYGKKRNHIIALQTEHKCVLDSCRSLEREGFSVTYLPVKTDGIVDLKVLEDAIDPNNTLLVCAMLVNNEIGVVQPIKAIGDICRKHGTFLHVDAAQAVGKIPVDVNDIRADTMSMSAHKMYGPKGVGALFVRRKQPRIRLDSIISGGGQERGMRSGTLPSPLIVGMGASAAIAARDMSADHLHITKLAEKLRSGLFSRVPEIYLNGSENERYVGNLNVSFAFVEGESLLMALKEIAVSSGSACTSASLEPSYVLRALGVDEAMAHTSLRFGIGRFTSEAEIDRTIELCVKYVDRLRGMSPLWDMHLEGIDMNSIAWTQH